MHAMHPSCLFAQVHRSLWRPIILMGTNVFEGPHRSKGTLRPVFLKGSMSMLTNQIDSARRGAASCCNTMASRSGLIVV